MRPRSITFTASTTPIATHMADFASYLHSPKRVPTRIKRRKEHAKLARELYDILVAERSLSVTAKVSLTNVNDHAASRAAQCRRAGDGRQDLRSEREDPEKVRERHRRLQATETRRVCPASRRRLRRAGTAPAICPKRTHSFFLQPVPPQSFGRDFSGRPATTPTSPCARPCARPSTS